MGNHSKRLVCNGVEKYMGPRGNTPYKTACYRIDRFLTRSIHHLTHVRGEKAKLFVQQQRDIYDNIQPHPLKPTLYNLTLSLTVFVRLFEYIIDIGLRGVSGVSPWQLRIRIQEIEDSAEQRYPESLAIRDILPNS